jgi:hypothetical protein
MTSAKTKENRENEHILPTHRTFIIFRVEFMKCIAFCKWRNYLSSRKPLRDIRMKDIDVFEKNKPYNNSNPLKLH